jgi:hypothetical protein
MDKLIASFVGRPPLMNGRFCTLTAPLDLSDEVLVAGGDVLNKAILELDSAGWNRDGMLHLVTPTRLRFQLATIREETLTVVLGTHEQHNLIQKSKYIFPFVSQRPITYASPSDIQAKARAIWDAAPDHLRYDRRLNGHFHHGWLTIVHFYLDYLYTCFLLYRAVIRHTNTGQADLCDVSRRVLAIVIQINSFRTPMVDMDRHFSWIVSPGLIVYERGRYTDQRRPSRTVFLRLAFCFSNFYANRMTLDRMIFLCRVLSLSET